MSALELHSPPPPASGYPAVSSDLARLRVIDRRKPTNARRSRRRLAHPFRAALVYTSLPAFVLVLYVSLWTAAVHGGYQEQRITHDIQRLKIENQTLDAEVVRLRSPSRICPRALALGMQERQGVEFVYLPGSAQSPVH